MPDKYLVACKEFDLGGKLCGVLDENAEYLSKILSNENKHNSKTKFVGPKEILSYSTLESLYWKADSHWHSSGAASVFFNSLGWDVPIDDNWELVKQKNDLAKTFGISRGLITLLEGRKEVTKPARIIKPTRRQIRDKRGRLMETWEETENGGSEYCVVASDSFFFDARSVFTHKCEAIHWRRVNSLAEASLFFSRVPAATRLIFIRAQKGFNFYRAQER